MAPEAHPIKQFSFEVQFKLHSALSINWSADNAKGERCMYCYVSIAGQSILCRVQCTCIVKLSGQAYCSL